MVFGQMHKALALIFGLFSLLPPPHVFASWQRLRPGIDYQELHTGSPTPWSRIHAFRIDLKSFQLKNVMSQDLAAPKEGATIKEFAQETPGALVTINGGFFDEGIHPLGLRISQHQQKNPLKPISWWGIFYIKDNKAYLSNVRRFKANPSIDFAVQSGPRLLVNGEIPPLKPGTAERTALGIRQDGRIIIVVSQNKMLTTTELAEIMKSEPLNCLNALNLDGGGSSQVYVNASPFHLDVPGFSRVSDAVIVTD